MERIAKKITKYLCNQKMIDEVDYELYKYGFQSGLELILCFAGSFLIAGLMGAHVNVLIFWMIFFAVRSYIGGIHLKKYSWCFAFSCLISNGISLVNKFFIIPVKLSSLIILGTSLYIIRKNLLKLRLEDNKAENSYFLKRVVMHTFIIMLAVLILYSYSCFEYISQCAYTMLIIVISALSSKIMVEN